MRPITDDLVEQVMQDLRDRYALDADDVRELGERLAGIDRRAENRAFAERFTDEHCQTFGRLSQ